MKRIFSVLLAAALLLALVPISAPAAEAAAAADKLPIRELVFTQSSSAGGWITDLTLREDGTFTAQGLHGGFDYDDVWGFEGRFTNIRKERDGVWSMQVAEARNTLEAGQTVYTADGRQQLAMIHTDAPQTGETWYLYAPGIVSENSTLGIVLGMDYGRDVFEGGMVLTPDLPTGESYSMQPYAASSEDTLRAVSETEETILEFLPYLGDAAKLDLTPDQLNAMADYLETFSAWTFYEDVSADRLRGTLCDADGSGIPIAVGLFQPNEYTDMDSLLITWEDGVPQFTREFYNRNWESDYVMGRTADGRTVWSSTDMLDGWAYADFCYSAQNGALAVIESYSIDSNEPNGIYSEYADVTLTVNGQVVASGITLDQAYAMADERMTVRLDTYTDLYSLWTLPFGRLAAMLRALAEARKLPSYTYPAVYPTASAPMLAEDVSYVGDAAATKMDAAMALAYAQALESLSGSSVTYAQLVDPGDGWPLLVTSDKLPDGFINPDPSKTALLGEELWQYADGTASVYDFSGDGVGHDGGFDLVRTPDGCNILYETFPGSDPGEDFAYRDCLYRAQGGRLTLVHVLDHPHTLDGQTVDDPREAAQIGDAEYKVFYRDHYMLEYYYLQDPAPASRTAAALREYAAAYTAAQIPEDPYINEVLRAVADAAGEEAACIWKLTEGVYYAVAAGSGRGVLVRASRSGGAVNWTAETRDTPMEQSELDAFVAGLRAAPNVSPDYGKLREMDTPESLAEYIEELLGEVRGLVPNDAAVRALAAFAESAAADMSSRSVSSADNRLVLDGEAASDLADRAREAIALAAQALEGSGAVLNRELVPTVRLLWQDVDWNAACEVTLEPSLGEALEGCTVQLLLADGQHYVQIASDTLNELLDAYGRMSIQFSKSGDTYALMFLDGERSTLERLPAGVTLGFPAPGEMSTVMASHGEQSDNWGGQYDPENGVIIIDTPYSGQYEVLENAVEITDIEGYDEETANAIRYLVSKGYMSAPDGRFEPEDILARYHFAKVLVGLFFALDRDAECTFEDVPEDSQYYVYVASGQQANLVSGVSATEFGGDEVLTVEQMLTFAGRTLHEHKGYAMPEDPEAYLAGFTDAADISDWAREQTALCVREGLVAGIGALEPGKPVTRAQGALILYRIFLKLHSLPLVSLDLPETVETPTEPSEDKTEGDREEDQDSADSTAPVPEDGPGNSGTTITILVAAVGGAAAVAAATAAVFLFKGRKRK